MFLTVLSACEGIKGVCVTAAKPCPCLSHNPGLLYQPQMLGNSSQQLHWACVRQQADLQPRHANIDVHSLGDALMKEWTVL